MFLTIASLGAILLGLIYIFKKDLAWKLQKYQIITWGLGKKERPKHWEKDSTLTGVMTVVIGIVLFIVSL